ncbi:rolling circle replication-associated protein [Candidatus Phytoplasma oryzae]|nr:hypothetical protein PIE28_01810 [Candidatus Phytoplasma oryzae]
MSTLKEMLKEKSPFKPLFYENTTKGLNAQKLADLIQNTPAPTSQRLKTFYYQNVLFVKSIDTKAFIYRKAMSLSLRDQLKKGVDKKRDYAEFNYKLKTDPDFAEWYTSFHHLKICERCLEKNYVHCLCDINQYEKFWFKQETLKKQSVTSFQEKQLRGFIRNSRLQLMKLYYNFSDLPLVSFLTLTIPPCQMSRDKSLMNKALKKFYYFIRREINEIYGIEILQNLKTFHVLELQNQQQGSIHYHNILNIDLSKIGNLKRQGYEYQPSAQPLHVRYYEKKGPKKGLYKTDTLNYYLKVHVFELWQKAVQQVALKHFGENYTEEEFKQPLNVAQHLYVLDFHKKRQNEFKNG